MKNKFLVMLALSVAIIPACKDDDDPTPNPPGSNTNFTINTNGLRDLGTGYEYEGWLIVNNQPVSAGRFTVNASGTPSQSSFLLDTSALNNATAYVLTIEPSPDTSAAPSGISILAGDFSGNTGAANVYHTRALNTSFQGLTGEYLLATPTTADMTDELSGVWFIDNSGGTMMAGLKNLPTLPQGWLYEGWIVVGGNPLTTGKFSSATGMDMLAPYSGPLPGPAFPGEDYVTNAPPAFTFPLDLSDDQIVITIEPQPDNSPEPFFLSMMRDTVPSNAAAMTNYTLNYSNSSFPTATFTR